MKSKPEPAAFSKRLLEFRKERGRSQPKLAKMIEASGTINGRHEHGTIRPSIEVARKLAEVFGVTVDHLVTDRDLPAILKDQSMVERWKAVDGLPGEERERILYVFDSLIREAQTRLAFRKTA